MLNKRYAIPVALLAALILVVLGAVALPGTVRGSTNTIESMPFEGRVRIIAVPGDGTTRYVPPPERALRAPATADILVLYGPGFPPQAQAAFEYAAMIWESLITSPVTILAQANWEVLGTGVLGQAGPTDIYRNFTGSPMPVEDTWYPSALADKLAGTNLGGLDFEATFNSDYIDEWYFGTDGNVPVGKLDFTSVVLHEMGHGLGFLGYMNVGSGTATAGYLGDPFIYDRFTETGSGASLLSLSSTQLYDALTGDNVFFDGPNARAANNGQPVRLYAPATWRPGSSYSHVDDIYDGTANALMTWSLADGEALHNPGPIALGVLKDTGWTLETDPPTVEPPPTSTNTSPPPTATLPGSSPTPTRTVTPLANPASYGYMPQALNDASKDNITPPPPPTNTPGGPTATATNTRPAPTPSPTGAGLGSIHGSVQDGGLPASGVTLELRHYDAGSGFWTTVDLAVSAADGSFSFSDPPSLAPGDLYYVLYRNTLFDIGRLWLWQTPYQDSFTAGQMLNIGVFDIADVVLTNPAPIATLNLPATFSWQVRTATPNDSYAFDLYDDLDPPTEFITDPLGYASSYTLQGLPAGFTTGIEYGWDVYIFNENFDPASPWTNGWGWSLEYRRVTFDAPGLQQAGAAGIASPRTPAGAPVDLHFRR